MYAFMKNRHLLKGRLRQEAWDEHTSIPAFRQMCEQQNARLAKPDPALQVTPLQIPRLPFEKKTLTPRPQDTKEHQGKSPDPFPLSPSPDPRNPRNPRFAQIYTEWLTPPHSPSDKALLYCIGGGYISGTCSDHRNMVAKIARGSGVKVLQFNHRLAPEDPFPAALEDALSAYRWLLDQGYLPENLMIVGESAGGGLCLATLLAIRDLSLPLPKAAVALSPFTDLTLSGESWRTRAKECLSPPGMNAICAKAYAAACDPSHPWISPLFGDLSGLPPLYLSVGDWETLRDDCTRFAAKAHKAGVDVTLVVGEKMVHCYPLMAPFFPEATAALADVNAFIRKQLRA